MRQGQKLGGRGDEPEQEASAGTSLFSSSALMEFLVVLCAQPQGDCAGYIPRSCILSEKPEVCGIIPDESCERPPPLSEVPDLYKGAASC